MKYNKETTSSRRKCRKKTFNSPINNKSSFSVRLENNIREKFKGRLLLLRKNDVIRVNRGLFRGEIGKVIQLNRKNCTVLVDTVTKKKTNQSNYFVPIHISNVSLNKLFITKERVQLLK